MGLFAILLSLLWIGGWIAASIWFRRIRGKAILPRVPANAVFTEDWCSGRSLRNGLTRMGGARNCLLVYVSDGQLVVTPRFPFTLMFLPEIYGFDLRVPVTSIASVEPVRRLWSGALRIAFRSSEPAAVELKLHDEKRFIEALGRPLPAGEARSLTAADRPRRRYRLTFFRVFMAIWGVGAVTVASYGLPDDYRFRRDGVQTTGVFDSHTEATGKGNDVGILSYSANGRRYHLTSLRGNGFYELGGTATLFYLPNNPEDAREASNLLFDLFWLFLGTVALAVSIFGGWIARRLWR